jgi:hypothetical protein
MNMTLTQDTSKPREDNKDLLDILGREFEEYFDGFGFDSETKCKDFFFYNVPEEFVDVARSRLTNYHSLSMRVRACN